jgi:hypothetical protein
MQWRRSVMLDETCTLLADVQTLVDIPPRIQKLVRRCAVPARFGCSMHAQSSQSPTNQLATRSPHRSRRGDCMLTATRRRAGGGRGLVCGCGAAARGVQPAGATGDVQGRTKSSQSMAAILVVVPLHASRMSDTSSRARCQTHFTLLLVNRLRSKRHDGGTQEAHGRLARCAAA